MSSQSFSSQNPKHKNGSFHSCEETKRNRMSCCWNYSTLPLLFLRLSIFYLVDTCRPTYICSTSAVQLSTIDTTSQPVATQSNHLHISTAHPASQPNNALLHTPSRNRIVETKKKKEITRRREDSEANQNLLTPNPPPQTSLLFCFGVLFFSEPRRRRNKSFTTLQKSHFRDRP